MPKNYALKASVSHKLRIPTERNFEVLSFPANVPHVQIIFNSTFAAVPMFTTLHYEAVTVLDYTASKTERIWNFKKTAIA